ncbi:hypothetical protein OG948_57935 (plasmid) [Embleya sp. NBC_00888]|uniref:hypothetical protein n=1 Tax=Embleya sp. NBC_00888 TaxID=2975960 RepID=UPI002F90FA99|nr:hypothetical protein OG948_57935 [Embleya sp. NBC_00888]
MTDSDLLLKFISLDASDEQSRSDPYRIQVLVRGVVLSGQVIAVSAFVGEALSPDQKQKYEKNHSVEDDARAYLHLHTDSEGEVGKARRQKIRIRIDHIDAWWPST